MGFETYTRILEEAVQELKEEEFQDLFADEAGASPAGSEVVVEPTSTRSFPAVCPHDTERLAIYRRLYALETEEQLQEVGEELTDRFGKHPPEVETLSGVVRCDWLPQRSGSRRSRLPPEMEVDFPPQSDTLFYEGEPSGR